MFFAKNTVFHLHKPRFYCFYKGRQMAAQLKTPAAQPVSPRKAKA
jgi:hypothetical protein